MKNPKKRSPQEKEKTDEDWQRRRTSPGVDGTRGGRRGKSQGKKTERVKAGKNTLPPPGRKKEESE